MYLAMLSAFYTGKNSAPRRLLKIYRQPPDLQYKVKKRKLMSRSGLVTINPKIYLDCIKTYKTIVYSRLID